MPFNSKGEEIDLIPEWDGTFTVDKWDVDGNHEWSKNTMSFMDASDKYREVLYK